MKLTDEIQSIIDSKKRSGDFHGLSLYLTQILTEMPDEFWQNYHLRVISWKNMTMLLPMRMKRMNRPLTIIG